MEEIKKVKVKRFIDATHAECTRCSGVFTHDKFGRIKNKKGIHVLHSTCNKCKNKLKHEKRMANPEAERLRSRNRKLKMKFGITINEYNEMLLSQDNRCAICGKEYLPGMSSFPVDHDHSTGKIREILCSNCNTALGGFKDNIDNLRGAILYLNKYRGDAI